MSEVLMTYQYKGRRTDVTKEYNGMFRVEFYVDGRLSHVTNSFSLTEAQRLAENYVDVHSTIDKGPSLLSE
jgi:hypothetical protein